MHIPWTCQKLGPPVTTVLAAGTRTSDEENLGHSDLFQRTLFRKISLQANIRTITNREANENLQEDLYMPHGAKKYTVSGLEPQAKSGLVGAKTPKSIPRLLRKRHEVLNTTRYQLSETIEEALA